MEPSPRLARVEELVLSGADVNVLNHATLSLWHFRQLVLEMLPSEAASAEPEDDQSQKTPEGPPPNRGIELGEGMSVAAVLFEETTGTLKPEKNSLEDAEPEGSIHIRTEGDLSRPALQLHGVTTHIQGQLTPDTRIAAVFQRYRCVLCLDASPSILSIDSSSGRLFLDLLYESVELFIWSMLRPMEVGGAAFTPEIHVSVLVQGALVESLCVLMQGYIVTPSNAAAFLQLIKERFQLIENDWASQAQELGQWGYLGNATPASLDWIVQNAVFALNSLPTDCTPMIVLVTDGVVDVRDAYSYDNLLMQLVRHDIQCHFLKVGGGGEDELNATFGFVPDTHLLRFVAEYTGGTVFDYSAIHESCYGSTSAYSNVVKKMTRLQDACFLRKSSVHANSAPVVKLNEMDSTSFDGRTLLPLRPYRMWREKVHEYRIFADVNRIVEARLREGFSINKIYVKTFPQPPLIDGAGVESAQNSVDAPSGSSDEVTKILIVFLLEWKQNVWLEYVVSTTTENSATLAGSAGPSHTGRRASGQGMKGPSSSSSTRKPAAIFSKDQRTAWSEWYVKMNILGYADFLRAFEDTRQHSSSNGDRSATTRGPGGDVSLSAPVFIHEFIRNVQDVDRVLLHLMTATASISEASDSVANQFSFGTSSSSASASVTPKITSSHPVFNIIGDLSTVLWHRWFFVERFEIICVVKSDACTDLFYRNEMHRVVERGNPGSHLRGPGNASQGMIHGHGASVYGTPSGTISIGVENLAEPLVAILVKWSSQKLSQDLFLKFIRPTSVDKNHAPPRAKASPSSATAPGGIAQRRRQRSHNNNAGEETIQGEDSTSSKESKAALCFVRLEFKNKTLCAIHVAFFATRASTRRQVLNDLKSTIFAGINEVAVTPSPAKLLSSSLTDTSVILCHRMLSRLLVTHDTLLLHGIDQEPGPFDYYVASPSLEAEKNTGAIPPSTTCCGGSELQLHRVFGAYVWHSSWKWEVANLEALLDVMRRLHNARISCGFWVLDWKMEEGDDGQSAHVESVIFGREILMEDEKGHTKTALVQYALRRVSDTCLMTSFWMEPQHGIVKTRLSDDVDHSDKFHWSLKQAIGHNVPFENYESRAIHRNTTPRGASGRVSVSSASSVEEEQKSMEQEDVSIDWTGNSTYLGESELLHLIRGYLFKSDRHFLSCLYTFDCIINLRENIELLNQLSKEVDGVVGSNWIIDRQMAAENGMILPPFSTARLLATSNRSTEHFLMYLQNGKAHQSGDSGSTVTEIPPSVSTANENLYSMLELTLRGLSDCEVSWTDYNGDVVANESVNAAIEDDQFFREGMDGQLPLWLKHHLGLTFKDRVPHHALSKGKCFAKLVSDDCVVLAFFPSLDTLQVKSKNKSNGASSGDSGGKLSFDEMLNMPQKAPGKGGEHSTSSQQFSVRAAEEDAKKERLVRMSVSADDIVLYQERRRSFREGYKSWRMGHFQGSRDEKQSYGRDFQKLRLPSTPEDHEFCEDMSRQAPYGCDFHLLIENTGEIMGSGFFQVAFYECSLSRLSTDLHDSSNQMLERVDLPHTILKQLFFSKRRDRPKEDRPAIPLDRSGLWRKYPVRSPSDSNGNTHARLSSGSILASRRFRKKVKRAHEHNFSRGVYMALREGGAVQHSDLLQALSSCIEVPVDVDITLLYRMMETAASQKILPLSPATAAVISAGIGADILKDKLTKSFEAILSSVFVPIAGTKYYYFTGNEHTIYEDLSASEYDLHILMEDSDDGDAITERQKREESRANDTAVATKEEQFRHSVDGGDPSAFSRLNTEPGEDADKKRPIRHRRGSLGRELPPVVTTADESSGSDQHHTNVEEDAEFNKEVAVATSSFSVPFFFKFECRLLNGSRSTRSNSADTHTSGPTNDSEILRRSSSTAAYEDMRKDMVAQAQLTSPSSRQEEFNAFLESLKASSGSGKYSNPTDATQIAETFSKMSTGRIALRLVTLTLPNERAFDGSRVPPQMPFEMDSSGQAGTPNSLPSTRSHSFSTLHLFQRQVLTRVRKDIKEWCSVEILSILKSANECTPAIGALVERLFDDLPEDAVTKATYPLEFVARSQETPVNPIALFKREFEKGDLLNVHRCNGVYFVVEKRNSGDKAVGLSGKSDQDAPGTGFEIPYWAFFELGSDHVTLRLHHPDRFKTSSKGFNRLEVLTRLQLGVRAVCRRVNQFLLLLQLHETRTCNGLLLPPNGNLPTSPRSPKRRTGSQGILDAKSGQDGQVKQGGFFWPGQFECELRYSAFFKLHERLAPTFALNMLCTSALEQFQVHNRRHIFVYRDRDGHVFYMKISIFYDTTLSPAVTSQPTEEPQERNGLARSSTGGSNGGSTTNSTSTTTPSGTPGIRLEVFGVSEAGEEVTHELCRLLERKLDEATQVVLMKLLARNTKFQLSPTDLAFLCPPSAEPSSMVEYVLPREVGDCCTLLHYLSQTLKLTPYIRPVTTGGSLPSRHPRDGSNNSLHGARRGSLASAGSTISLPSEDSLKTIVQDTTEDTKLGDSKGLAVLLDSTQVHPSCFGGFEKALTEFQQDLSPAFDAATISPVYFSKKPEADVASVASSAEGSISGSPEVVAQASYVLNLNPDLRLSQGFLSRVGKGLALMRVDLVRNSSVVSETKEEDKEDTELSKTQRVKRMLDIPGLAALYSNDAGSSDVGATSMIARCQVWIRGSIHTTELSQVVEAILDEALYDYHIEAIIKKLQSSNGRGDNCTSSEDDHAPGQLHSNVDSLKSLLKSASQLPSSSVTSLGVNLSIAQWDLENAVAQIRTFLCCLPQHLRPVVYAKSKLSGCYESVANHNEGVHVNPHVDGIPADTFRLVVKHVGDPDACEGLDSSDSDGETTASMSSALHHIEPLMRTDSIHSEISDIDSVSGRMPLTWASAGASSDSIAASHIQTAPSVSSTTSSLVGMMGGMPHQLHLPKNASFSERDVMLYSSSGNSYHHHHKLSAHEHREVKRSFYYVVDISASKGLQVYGYNMSAALVEALATHIARVLTWTMLREKLLQSLLLEKSGISAAAPVGSVVLQPRSLFLTVGRTERAGKGMSNSPAVLCKDSAVHFIEYRTPVLSILQANEWFPRVLDASRLRSIDGISLGVYLREAQTQPMLEGLDSQYARPRGKSNTNLGVSIGPPSIPDLSRETSGPSLSQRSLLSNGDAPPTLLGSQTPGRTRSGGIVSSSNVSDSLASSPNKRLNRPNPSLPYPGGDRSEVAARMRGTAGAATALMAARARARGGSAFPGRIGGGPGVGSVRGSGNSGSSSAVASGDSVAPWDLPLSNTKGPRLHSTVDASTSHDGVDSDLHTGHGSGSANTLDKTSKGKLSIPNRPVRRGSRGTGLSELGSSSSSSSLSGLATTKTLVQRRGNNAAVLSDPGRIHSSWKKRLECAWGPRFLFPGSKERWTTRMTAAQQQHFIELEDEDDHLTKNLTPLPFFCTALEKRWEAFETRSTSHTVSMNLLEKLASLRADEEMEEPVAKDVVAHLMESGHLLLHQRFRAAFVERWIAAEVIGLSDSEDDEVVSSRLHALQSCMDLVHLLSYKREFVFDEDECSVAKLYTEHTVFSMGASAGADIRGIKQQVAANLEPLRLEVASAFYKEYAVHLRTLGFRRLRTLNTGRTHARAFPVDHGIAATESEVPGGEGFSEYFYHPERAAAETGDWKADATNMSSDAQPLSIVVLEVKCDNRGVRLTAVLVSLHDLEQQDLRFQNRLAAKAGKRVTGVSGARVQCVASWLRAQLQTQALIYGFTIRYFQQHILQWIDASHSFHDEQDGQGHSVGKHLSDDDALVVTPPMPWKKTSTFQNIVKGLQCFLHAFPGPPEELKKHSPPIPTPVAARKSASKTSATSKLNDPRTSSVLTHAAPGSDGHRSNSRAAARFARRAASKHHHQQQAAHAPLPSSGLTPKSATPLSQLWRNCVIRMATVTLQPTSLQSNCVELIMVQILLRYIGCHGSRYEVLDLLQFGTPDAVVCHSSSGSFFHRTPSTITPSTQTRKVEPLGGYSLLITTQPLTCKPLDKDSVQLLLLKSTPSELGVGNGVLPVERALQEAQLFTRELFRVAAQHYERDLLWSRLLFDDSRGPGADVARTLVLPPDLFRVEVGPQQLEECLRLSICTPLETLDPRLDELLRVSGVCWQELALRLQDIYADQIREFQFQEEGESSSHLLLLCPDTFDLIIHLKFITPKDPMVPSEQLLEGAESVSGDESVASSSRSASANGGSSISEQFSEGGFPEAQSDVRVEICRREEPTNKQFTFAQRRSISEFVNSIVHWQWRSLIYD